MIWIAILGLNNIERTRELMDGLQRVEMRKRDILVEVEQRVQDNGRAALVMLVGQDVAATASSVAANRERIGVLTGEYRALAVGDEAEAALLARAMEQRRVFLENIDAIAGMMRDEGMPLTVRWAAMKRVQGAQLEYVDTVRRLSELSRERSDLRIAGLHADLRYSLWGMGLILVVSALAAVALGIWIVRGVTGELGTEPWQASDIADAVSCGDLTREVPAFDDARADSVAGALKRMQEGLRVLVISVRRQSVSLAEWSNMVRGLIRDLRADGERFAGWLSEMASEAEGASRTFEQIARNAGEARHFADNTGRLADAGGESVVAAVSSFGAISSAVGASADAMHELGERSAEISRIVLVIKEIAERTNLLALNAAIEAARAGEHGQGFAVVADEVRKLAERTTGSTREIGEMVGSIQAAAVMAVSRADGALRLARDGDVLAERAGTTIAEMRGEIGRLVREIASISDSLEGGKVAMRLIAENVHQAQRQSADHSVSLDQVGTVVENMDSLAQALRSEVGQFVLPAGMEPADIVLAASPGGVGQNDIANVLF
jgi:methyl-accepting chemotaxis protein